MTTDTQQFVIKWGFVGVMLATLSALIGLAVLAIVHDGALADQMTNLFTGIVQQGLYLLGGLIGLHTVVAGLGGVKGTATPPTAPVAPVEPVAGS